MIQAYHLAPPLVPKRIRHAADLVDTFDFTPSFTLATDSSFAPLTSKRENSDRCSQ